MLSVCFYLERPPYRLAVYEKGNPQGIPVIFLHGGPGGSISEQSFSFFDLDQYHVFAFDQRGCGQSVPFACLTDNTVLAGAEDVEALRQHLGIDQWIVFGGSYGTTLALSVAILAPAHVRALVLRGVFLGRDEDIRWLYQEGASWFYPENHEAFKSIIAPEDQADLVRAYAALLTSDDRQVRRKAAKYWAQWEMGLVRLVNEPINLSEEPTDAEISMAQLECYFFVNHMFWANDNYILSHAQRYQDIPTWIVHGRYDVDCRLSGAYELMKVLRQGHLIISEASGHSPYDPANFAHLKKVMEELSECL